MRVACIAAGAGGMYCGSCIHDNTLAAALMRLGVDVTLVPTYTPLRTDEESVSLERVFYGGISVYLAQKSALVRRLPPWATRPLDRPGLLRWAAGRFAGSTEARDLGALTLSVLRGEEGRQRRQLEELCRWLSRDLRPDLVQLTNTMFAGLAGPLKRALGRPVLCAVQGEEIFLDRLAEPFRAQAREELRRRAGDVDGFLSPSAVYADFMAGYLDVPRDRFHVVPLGLRLEGHGPPPETERGPGPFRIGFLARICPEKGLHVAAGALRLLAERLGPEAVRLEAAGWLGPADLGYFEEVKGGLETDGLAFAYHGAVDRAGKIEFLRSLHALTVPAPYHEPKGLYVLEALANGVPVVQPRHGAFPELVEGTGGGLLVDAAEPEAVAAGLQALFEDEEHRLRLGRRGRAAVHERYGDAVMAARTREIYERFLPRPERKDAP